MTKAGPQAVPARFVIGAGRPGELGVWRRGRWAEMAGTSGKVSDSVLVSLLQKESEQEE